MKIVVTDLGNSWDIVLRNNGNDYFLRNFWKTFCGYEEVEEELKRLGDIFDLSSVEIVQEDRS